MDPRTVRAAVAADLLTFLGITGIALFLGFDLGPALIGGALMGLLSGGIVLGAAARARSLGTDRPAPSRPGFPGAPEHVDAAPDADPSPAGDDTTDDAADGVATDATATDPEDTDEDHRG